MLRPRRFDMEIDPGPVQIHARRVRFDVAEVPTHWIPRHPVASHMISLLNVVLPAAERWFVATYDEALPLVRDPKLAEDIRGFIGQESTHAEAHLDVLNRHTGARDIDVAPILDLVEHIFEKMLVPSRSSNPKRRMNHLCDRLWLIAAIEHYTAVLGDFSLNSAWDDHDADPTMVDLFRWHGSEEVEHRMVAHDVATYFHDSYIDRIRAMCVAAGMIFSFFEMGVWHLVNEDPTLNIGFVRRHRMRMRDSKLGLLPLYRELFGSNTFIYFKRGFTPEIMGSTAQAVAYLASSPAARAARI